MQTNEHVSSLEGVMSTISDAERQDLDRYEAVITKGLGTFIEVGNALIEIRRGRLYRAQYPTFVEYCNKRWNISDRRARQLMTASVTAQDILPPQLAKLLDLEGMLKTADQLDRHGRIPKPPAPEPPRDTPQPDGKTGNMFPVSGAVEDLVLLDNKSGKIFPVSPDTGYPLLNESQAHELSKIPQEHRTEVLKIAFDTAPKGKLTAAHIKQVARTIEKSRQETATAKAKPTATPKPTSEALQRQERQIAEALRAIQSQKLWRKADARSFDDYLEGLVERIKGEL